MVTRFKIEKMEILDLIKKDAQIKVSLGTGNLIELFKSSNQSSSSI